jgi:hypothetical protein
MKCQQCKFYSQIADQIVQGECRIYPPKIFLVPVQTIQGQGISAQIMFPTVRHDGWCGQCQTRLSALD